MGIGMGQLVLIILGVLIVFGAGKIPSIMGDLAKGLRAFKKGMDDQDSSEAIKHSSKD